VQGGILVDDRPLRACLVASHGRGAVFLDETDPADERRFSVGHEVSHLLLYYLLPRRRAVATLGDGIHDVLDGRRPPSAAARAPALLAGVHHGLHVHLMERTPDGHAADGATTASEANADRLAYELLAPADAVLARVDGVVGPGRTAAALAVLKGDFGFPDVPADRYAALLAPPPDARSLVRRLRLVR
jgi:hypothetical protein